MEKYKVVVSRDLGPDAMPYLFARPELEVSRNDSALVFICINKLYYVGYCMARRWIMWKEVAIRKCSGCIRYYSDSSREGILSTGCWLNSTLLIINCVFYQVDEELIDKGRVIYPPSSICSCSKLTQISWTIFESSFNYVSWLWCVCINLSIRTLTELHGQYRTCIIANSGKERYTTRVYSGYSNGCRYAKFR